MRAFSLIVLVLLCQTLPGQHLLQEEVEAKLQTLSIDIFVPPEESTLQFKEDKNDFFRTDFLLEQKGDLEVKIETLSIETDSHSVSNPHIQNGIRIGHLMSNTIEGIVSLHQLGSEELKEYNADWGTQAIFKPKLLFSTRTHCQLISLYKEEVGLVFIYLLFDDIEQYQDVWKYLLSFKEETQK